MMIDSATRWTHNRDGYGVIVAELGEVLTKDANDARFQKGVGFYRIDHGDNEGRGPLYVRSEADFLAKFTQNDLRDEGDVG